MGSAYERLDFITIEPHTQQPSKHRELQLATIRSHAGSVRTSRLPPKTRSRLSAINKSQANVVADRREESGGTPDKHRLTVLLLDPLQEGLDSFDILGSVGLPNYALHVLDFG